MQLSSKFLARILLLMVVINNTSAGISLAPLKLAFSYVATEVAESVTERGLITEILTPLKNSVITSIQTLVNNIPEKVRPYVQKVTNLLNVFTQVGPTVDEVENAHYYDISNDVAEKIQPESTKTTLKRTETGTTQSTTIAYGNSQNPQRNNITQFDANKIIEALNKISSDGFSKVKNYIDQGLLKSTQNINEHFKDLKNEMKEDTLALENFITTGNENDKLNRFYTNWNLLKTEYQNHLRNFLIYYENNEKLVEIENEILKTKDVVNVFVNNHIIISNPLAMGLQTPFFIMNDILEKQKTTHCRSKGAQWFIYEEYLKIITTISKIMNLIIHVKIDQFNRKNNQADMNLEYEKRKLEALQESLDIYETYAKNIYDIASDAYYATKKASNVVRTCDPGVHVKDVTYQNFVRIQQGYIGPTNTDDPDDPFIEIVKNQYSTWVSVTNCTKPEHEVTVYSDTKNMERYFEFAEETTTNSRRKIHGLKSQPKKPYDSTSYTSHQIESDNVQKCMIKYEDEFSEHSIRFVSLQLKTTFPNYFVTGIRLKITNQILHLEIQQGKMSNGKILNNTIHWLPSSKQTIYHKEMLVDVSKTNGFFMNDVEFEDGNFLTGVGFQVLDSYDKNGEIKLLTIIAQRQDLKPQSDVSKRQWLRKLPDTDALLIELKLNEPDLSIKANSSKVLSTPGQHYIPIQVTSMKKDAAQSMVPYLDIQELYAPGLMPFRGIGMYYRGTDGYGGFIGLNAFSHSISDLIDLKKLEEGKKIVTELINKVELQRNLITKVTDDLKSHKISFTESIIKKLKNFK